MEVRDIVTGNTLKSENEMVIASWKDDPERFVVLDGEQNDGQPTGKKPASKKS